MSGTNALSRAYRQLLSWWDHLSPEQQIEALGSFAIVFAYNSGHIENNDITFEDTREIFERNRVVSFTGTMRTLYEMGDLRNAWGWTLNHTDGTTPLTSEMVLRLQWMLTYGTYDDDRWQKGERPGTYKQNQYTIGITGAGAEPEDVGHEMDALTKEIRGAMRGTEADRKALVIAAYLHAKLVDIHPFSNGNGRMGRLLTNWVLLSLGHPPITIFEQDRMSYYGALGAFHEEGDLDPFLMFLRAECIKSWQRAFNVSAS